MVLGREVGAKVNLLVIIDHYSKWTEIVVVKNKKGSTVRDAFIKGWFLKFGAPAIIVSDMGTEFQNSLWKELSALLQMELKPTPGYTPQQNSIVERDNAKIKYLIRTYAKTTTSWIPLLPFVQAALNQQPHTALAGLSPYQVVFGMRPRDPIEVMKDVSLLSPPTYSPSTSIFNVAQVTGEGQWRFRILIYWLYTIFGNMPF